MKAILAKFAEAVNTEIVSGLRYWDHQRAGLPLPEIDYLYRSVVVIAAQRNDLSVFSENFPDLKKPISDVSFLSVLFKKAQPEFMEKVMQLRNFRLQHNPAMDFHSISLQELKYIFSREVRSHACQRHLEFLVQEIFSQSSCLSKSLHLSF